MRFASLASIDIKNKADWQDRFYLTFDVDWASDEVLAYAIDMVEQSGVAATWFITHETHMLSRLRANPLFELGIHPNFNALLIGQAEKGEDHCSIIKRLLDIVPEAKTVRSHSLTQSTHLLNMFVELGLTHDSNVFIPWHAGGELYPWQNWNGLTRIPYCWEDHVAIITNRFDLDGVCAAKGIRVLDFHPIHLALNTDSIERYEKAKPFQRDWKILCNMANKGDGVRTSLEILLSKGAED
ncbi:MAG: hypothetical protein NDI81_08345 [Desulfobacula sp.]|nr:hypothetical protein [Desulfobacula sp.]